MNLGRVPAPDFDESRYERPNQDWVCGRARDGCPCRIGPSSTGACRATAECQPALVVAAGATKGTWKCTRPKEWGGPCEHGPGPDGRCGRPLEKCHPVRSLRARRGLVTRAVVAAAAAALLLGLGSGVRDSFLNPAPLSRHHSGPEFLQLAAGNGGGQGCVLCHEEANANLADLARSALRAASASLTFPRLTSEEPRDLSRMDPSCLACHERQSFHHAAVVRPTACATCHRDHQGSEGLALVAGRHCTDCHGDAGKMLASAAKARGLPPAELADRPAAGVVVFTADRSAAERAQLVTGFSQDHPEFRAVRPGQIDANPLKFNHRLHLTSATIPPFRGHRLECADCHRPDASGAFMQRVTFAAHCRDCHSLNFDERNPGMTLPHGDTAFARAYLRNLPSEYADHARRALGIANRRDVDAFVAQQINSLRERNLLGEDLERAAFFSDGKTGPAAAVAGRTGEARAKFAGCATCHQVTPQDHAPPVIATPRTPDRWFLHARFNHAKHTAVACTDCHAAESSERTTDILMPNRQSCVRCHGPQVGVAETCGTCHHYHNPPPQIAGGSRRALVR